MDFYYQYELVKSSRKVLLEYCSTLSAEHFLTDNSSFGRGSIRNLLVHMGNTYQFWIGKHALGKDTVFTGYGEVQDASGAERFFVDIDTLMVQFINAYASDPYTDLHLSPGGKKLTVSPMTLFTHVITHEFHHKGQVLSLSRHLGYTPVDTDIIR